ncbi:MAG: Txe/YoeB family addiction module toxin [Moraxellaceae bacterium]|nr:Txe/YoeB family addiction module toxin [Moraxellaceae bacterium]
MTYTLIPTEDYLSGLAKHKKHGNKKLLTKVERFLSELQEHPREGTGQVEQLKHFGEREVYSRRIDREHRLVYEIIEEQIIIILISAYGHY